MHILRSRINNLAVLAGVLTMLSGFVVAQEDPDPPVASTDPTGGTGSDAAQETSESSTQPAESGKLEEPEVPAKYLLSPHSLSLRRVGVRAPRFGVGRRRSFEDAFSDTLDYESSKNSLLNIDVTQKIENIDGGDVVSNFRDPNTWVVRDGVDFDLGEGHIKADSLDADRDAGILKIEGNVSIVSPGSRLTADSFFLERKPAEEIADMDLIRYRLLPHGHDPNAVTKLGDGILETYNLKFTEPNRAFSADYIQYDSVEHKGELTNARGFSDPFYFSASRLRILGPGSFEADDIWLTTCDLDNPHYRIRFSQAKVQDGRLVVGKKTKLQVGKKRRTFFFIPKISGISFSGKERLRFEIETGQRSELGYYVNFAQWYAITPNLDLAYRFYPTANEGLGIGFDGVYDFRQNPATRLFGSKGEFETMYTTEKRGFTQWYHRQELSDDLTLLAQWEQWYDRDFVKDFYNSDFEDRSGPRTFVNLTYLKDRYIVTGSASKSTHDFLDETERLPEATLHVLERRFGNGFYVTLDSAVGSYNHVPEDIDAQRYSQVARLSYDLNIKQGLNVVPFVEGSATHYSETLSSESSDSQMSALAGVTTQMRFQRGYKGIRQFDGFKHIMVPSLTYFHEKSSSIDVEDVPRFDRIDSRLSRDRIESKFDNVVLGRNAKNGEVWRVARLSLYQGTDFSNEISKTTDYQLDMEIRPRPWWGVRSFAERHEVDQETNLSGRDFDRILSFIFYDDDKFENSFNARVGYSETRFGDTTVDREIIYGAGYKLSKNWSVSADHTIDLERDEIRRQSYQIHRRLHKWDMGLRVRNRPSGTDINVVFSLVGFSGTDIRF